MKKIVKVMIERRIKCDEARPHCTRCSSTGRKCDGYGPSPNHRFHIPSFSPSNLSFSENSRESRCFQYFYERTAPALTGISGSIFWNIFVLQLSQREKSVWHAIVALGSLHEKFVEKEQRLGGLEFLRREQDAFTIREYSTAIRALLSPAGKTNGEMAASGFGDVTIDVCLISCILFTCFEVGSPPFRTRRVSFSLARFFPATTPPPSTTFEAASESSEMSIMMRAAAHFGIPIYFRPRCQTWK